MYIDQILNKIEKYDDWLNLFYEHESREKCLLFPVTIVYVNNLEALGYFFFYGAHRLQDLG